MIATLAISGLLYLRLLTFPLARDEAHYWLTIERFAREPIPSVELLRSYGELAAPLAFIVFGWIEALAGHGTTWGIVLGRWFSLATTLGTLIVIGWRAPEPGKAALAALGLCLCPYFLGVGFHLYTDGIATFLAVLAIRQHVTSRFTSSAVAWVLTVSTRQYVVALAAGMLVYECFRFREHGAWARIASPSAGCLTLTWWMLFWGGLGPAPALLDNTGGATIGTVRPEYGLYALACIGAYHVIPESFLMRARFRTLDRAARRALFMTALALALAFVWFPPLHNPIFVPTMGYLDIAARWLLRDDRLRMMLFFGLSLLAAHRWLRKLSLGFWLVLAQISVMSLAQVAWDKYSLPLFASLWFLSAWRAIIQPRHR